MVNRWLVTGAAGMLGRDLVGVLQGLNESVVAVTRQDLDITDRFSVRAVVSRYQPTTIVNCAAWTRFPEAEVSESEALLINGRGVRELASICSDRSIRLVHLSTDYVFDGTSCQPYAESAATSPINAYGRTKLAGEQAVLELLPDDGTIVRTAWLYGRHGTNFIRKMVRLEQMRKTVDVVDDQWGQPTWTVDLAQQIVALVRQGASGVFHGTSSGETTWYDIARMVFRLLGADPGRIRPVRSDQVAGGELRPRYTVLGHAAWREVGLTPIRHWATALTQSFPLLVDGES
uniref:dTDP-4-dehydrorhamnose reductase n=2 Tax=Streptomyces roseochromogenus TaxID=285450 RepID=Q8GHB0_STRRC|nr:dTDP-4-dehydrorhamnose reductase [Streptomyces roseochromogenus]AAN65241.1 dTDP-4-keto-6-deoxyhexose reductase [Streptomyces roseochromogenus subsp. oscitans DS 12.976]